MSDVPGVRNIVAHVTATAAGSRHVTITIDDELIPQQLYDVDLVRSGYLRLRELIEIIVLLEDEFECAVDFARLDLRAGPTISAVAEQLSACQEPPVTEPAGRPPVADTPAQVEGPGYSR